jgi:hypothetical protein
VELRVGDPQAEHRCQPDELGGVGSEGEHTGQQEVLHPPGTGVLDQLSEQVRIALGPLVPGVHVDVRGAGECGHQLRALLPVQPLELDVGRPGQARQLAHRLLDPADLRGLVVAQGQDETQPPASGGAGEVDEEVAGGLVRPVEVVDDKGGRRGRAARRQGVGPEPDGLEALLGRLVLRAVGRRRPPPAGEEDLLERGQRKRLARELQTRPLDDFGDRVRARGGHERGLPDPRLAADQHDVPRFGERRGNGSPVVHPPDIGDAHGPDHPIILPSAGDAVQAVPVRPRPEGTRPTVAAPARLELMSSSGAVDGSSPVDR